MFKEPVGDCNPQREERERGRAPQDGCEGSRRGRGGEKRSPPGAVSETEREREQGREGLWESFAEGGREGGNGGCFQASAAPDQETSSGPESEEKKKKVHSRLAIISQLDRRGQSASRGIAFNESLSRFAADETDDSVSSRAGRCKQRTRQRQITQVAGHMTSTNLLFKSVHVRPHTPDSGLRLRHCGFSVQHSFGSRYFAATAWAHFC